MDLTLGLQLGPDEAFPFVWETASVYHRAPNTPEHRRLSLVQRLANIAPDVVQRGRVRATGPEYPHALIMEFAV